jgi:AAA15 family ATPase/GTPase
MLEQFTVENFKGFEKLTLDDLGHINIFVGKNNTGKTSLLQAISLASVLNPNNLDVEKVNLRLLLSTFYSGRNMPSHELFNQFNGDEEFNLIYGFSDSNTKRIEQEVTMQLSMVHLSEFSIEEQVELEERSSPYRGSRSLRGEDDLGDNDKVFKSCINIKNARIPSLFEHDGEGGQAFQQLNQRVYFLSMSFWKGLDRFMRSGGLPTFVFKDGNSHDLFLKRFAEILKEMREKDILAELQKIEANLKQLFLIGDDVFCDVQKGTVIKRISLSSMGDGLKKMFKLLLYMDQMDSLYMIDEPENGFHYSVQSQFWQLLANAGLEHGKQSFIATHSYELLESLNTLLKNKDKAKDLEGLEVRVYELERIEGQLQVTKITQDIMSILIKNKSDFRG